MKLLKSLRRISLKSFWSLFKLSLKNPLFIYPTLMATSECIQISTRHFGREHMKNGQANAFRHALWNFLIAHKCTKWSKNGERIEEWTKSITDWHEEAFKNRDLARLMDLHNNEVGRRVFIENTTARPQEVIDLLLKKSAQSVKISNKEALTAAENSLVHLTE